MICISLYTDQYQICKNNLTEAPFIELRFDRCNLDKQDLNELLLSGKKIIATCRKGYRSDGQRLKLLMELMKKGVDLIDLDMEDNPDNIKKLISFAREKSCKIILSYHNYHITPKIEVLKKILSEGFSSQADIVKIATTIHSGNDLIRLLSVYENVEKDLNGRILAFGMGELGKVTRVLAPILGAPFTYASCPMVSEQTGPGQLNVNEMSDILKILIK